MDIKKKIQTVLREQYGEPKTILQKDYINQLTDNLSNDNRKIRDAWATYNQVVLELKNTLKESLKAKELQYRLTDNTDCSEVCIDVIESITNKTPELERLYYKVKSFTK